uniref:Uncharacterized protein n=1 Tax=Rhizophora mucronata TaxID=61149 RepID=A0A2P2NSC6_RHIMU
MVVERNILLLRWAWLFQRGLCRIQRRIVMIVLRFL